MNRFQIDLKLKLDKNDASKIWEHFQRFAMYDDLKDLYSKCIPQLVKYEQKMADYEVEMDKHNMIIRSFDE